MKSENFRDLSIDELKQKELDLYKAMINLRVQASVGQLENPLKLRSMRRQVARIKTILRENEISPKGVGE